MTFTSTKVPKFAGVTSWEQFRQVFDAIIPSNGWNNAIAALQLLSHLECDALNVALLVPKTRRETRFGLVGRQVYWWIIATSLRRRPGKPKKTLPYLQYHWRHGR